MVGREGYSKPDSAHVSRHHLVSRINTQGWEEAEITTDLAEAEPFPSDKSSTIKSHFLSIFSILPNTEIDKYIQKK